MSVIPEPIVYIAQRIRQLRNAAGLTQRDLAQRIGVSYGTVSRWECGKAMPTEQQLCLLARALNVSRRELRGETRAANPRLIRIPRADNLDALGERIRIYRERAGWTADELAERVGVSANSVRAWERGQYAPTWGNLRALASTFGVSTKTLLTGSEAEEPDEDDASLRIEFPDEDETIEASTADEEDEGEQDEDEQDETGSDERGWNWLPKLDPPEGERDLTGVGRVLGGLSLRLARVAGREFTVRMGLLRVLREMQALETEYLGVMRHLVGILESQYERMYAGDSGDHAETDDDATDDGIVV